MSSAPSADQRRTPPGPPPERKAAAGPVITPQVLAIVFGIILVIGLIVYYQMVVANFNKQLSDTESAKAATQQRIKTYQLKQSKLDEARQVNVALREKLNLIDYLFLFNQDSVMPFYENTLLPIISGSRLTTKDSTVIEADPYTFQMNMAMAPFNTLPHSLWFEDVLTSFPIEYHGEKGGVPTDSPLNTQPTSFLTPYNITMVDWVGTYEDVKDFIEHLQTARDDILVTVHCLKNDSSDNYGVFRTYTPWTIALTVYFMNPEETAQGDNPPALPGASSC